MKTTVETITPKIALAMLGQNKKNRNLAKRTVTNYANQIKKGQWKLNGDAIRFAEDGTLIDGQHRLSAIIEAETPVKMSVIRDLPKDVIKTLDIGRKRTNADHMKIYGFDGSYDINVIAASVKLCMFFETGAFVQSKLDTSPTDVINFLEKNKGLLHSDGRVPSAIGKIMPRSVAITMHYLFSKIDREKANKLLFMGQHKSGSAAKRQIIYYICRSFDAFINNEEIQKLQFYATSDIVLPKKKKEKK